MPERTSAWEYPPQPDECGAPFDMFGRVRVYCNAAPGCRANHSYDSPSGFTVDWPVSKESNA